MAKETGTMHGPIQSVMTDVPGNPDSYTGTESCIYDGVPGYSKGSGGKIKEVTMEEGGAFGQVKTNQKG